MRNSVLLRIVDTVSWSFFPGVMPRKAERHYYFVLAALTHELGIDVSEYYWCYPPIDRQFLLFSWASKSSQLPRLAKALGSQNKPDFDI